MYRAGDKMEPELANQSGYFNHASGKNWMGWVGICIKNLLVEEIRKWLHPDSELVNSERNVEMIKHLDLSDRAEPTGTHSD